MEPRTNVLDDWEAVELLTFYERIRKANDDLGNEPYIFFINAREDLSYLWFTCNIKNKTSHLYITPKELELMYFFTGSWDEEAAGGRLVQIAGLFRNAIKAKVDVLIPPRYQ